MRPRLSAVTAFIHTEASSGLVLAAAALAGMVWANSPWSHAYESLLHASYAGIDVEHAVSEGLMTIFFLVVGLEIAREFREGELRERRTALMPIVAAVGGMAVPALVFFAFNAAGGGGRGWAIPTATDIAFALGVLALLGSRVPAPLRVFLLALAIVDDIGAIVVLAIFYSTSLAPAWLGVAAVLMAGYAVTARVARSPRIVVPLLVLLLSAAWFALFQAGIHPTLVGVAAGILTPPALARSFEHGLHPWSVFLVLPLFALANSGVSLSGAGEALTSRIGLGIALGLVVGKPLGIVLGSAIAARLAHCPLPGGASWRQVTGVGLVAGTGFTVSLFVTSLAYVDPERIAAAKVGIVAGSVAAASLGALLLAGVARREAAASEPEPEAQPV